MTSFWFFSTFLPPLNVENNLPISPSLISFDLDIKTISDIDSLNLILKCMPNLRRLILALISSSFISPTWEDMLDGQYWEELLTIYVPQMNTFDLFLRVYTHPNSYIDIDDITHSFDYFATIYNDWYLTINQSQCCFVNPGRIIIVIYF